MTVLSLMEYPHWLMMAGALLLALGLIGLALKQRSVEAEPRAGATSDHEPLEPETDLTPEEVYHRTAKEKRRARWAESSEEPLDAESKT